MELELALEGHSTTESEVSGVGSCSRSSSDDNLAKPSLTFPTRGSSSSSDAAGDVSKQML